MEQCRLDADKATAPITDVFVCPAADPAPDGCYRVARSDGGRSLDLSASIFVRKGSGDPVVGLAVVLPDRGERVPPGFAVARAHRASAARGDLNPGGEAVLLCVRKDPHGAALTDLGVVLRGEAAVGAQVIAATPMGNNADFDHFSRLGPCISYRQTLPCELRAVATQAALPARESSSKDKLAEEDNAHPTRVAAEERPPPEPSATAPTEEWRLTLLRPLLVAQFDRRAEVGAQSLEGLQALLLRHNFFRTGAPGAVDTLLCLCAECICENCLACLDPATLPLKLAFLRSVVASSQAALPLKTLRLLVAAYLATCEDALADRVDLGALPGYTCLRSLVHALLRRVEAEIAPTVGKTVPLLVELPAEPAACAAESDAASVVAAVVAAACRISELSREVDVLEDAIRRGRLWCHLNQGAERVFPSQTASQGLLAVLAALVAGASANDALTEGSCDEASMVARKDLCLAALNDLLAASGSAYRASSDWGFLCRRLVVPLAASTLPLGFQWGRLLRRSLASLTLIWRHSRRHVRLEIGSLVTDVLLPCLTCRGAGPLIRGLVLAELASWVDDKMSLPDMFLNFNVASSGASSVLERMCGAVCAVAEEAEEAPVDHPNESAAEQSRALKELGVGEDGLQLSALHVMGSMMRGLLDLCGHAFSTGQAEAAVHRLSWEATLAPVDDESGEEEAASEGCADQGEKDCASAGSVAQKCDASGDGGGDAAGATSHAVPRTVVSPLRAPPPRSQPEQPPPGREKKSSFAVRLVEQHASAAVLEQGLGVYRAKGLAKAVAFLVAKGFIADAPRDVASFLRIHHRHFSPVELGDFLGSGEGPHWEGVRAEFVKVISFRGLLVEQALRTFLTESHFRLPGEAQKVDRLICCFANRWWADNPAQQSFGRRGSNAELRSFADSPPMSTAFSALDSALSASPPLAQSPSHGGWWQPESVDAVYLLAFATIMLNTDLHRAGHKKHKKMTREQFVHNLSRSDAGLPVPMLGRLYDSVLQRPIQMAPPPSEGAEWRQDAGREIARMDGADLQRQLVRTVVECEELWRSQARERPPIVEADVQPVSLEVAAAMFGAVGWQARALLSSLLDRSALRAPFALAYLDLLQSAIGAAMLLGLEKETLALALLLDRTKSTWEMLAGDAPNVEACDLRGTTSQEPWFLAVVGAARRTSGGALAAGSEPPLEVIAAHLMPVLVGLRGLVESDEEARSRRRDMERVAATVDNGANLLLRNPRRWLVKEGDLVKRSVSSGKREHYRFWLFSDMLAYGHRSVARSTLGLSGTYRIHHQLLLGHLRAAPDDGPTDICIIHPLKAFAASAATEEERDDWLLRITQTSAACMRPGLSHHGGSFADLDIGDEH